jgi:hypothetical protein
MTPTKNELLLTEMVYGVVLSTLSSRDEIAAVRLKDGGVIVTSPDGDHVWVLVQSCHFEPGQEPPF